ncbi:MAG TPA: Hsp70 family protein [Solirubrobacterales bacterium]|nr:Hsp70 family protein [Solirubrobacterales bacterium]
MNNGNGDASTTVWGIDLGTTYSCISRVDEFGRPVVVNNRDGDPVTPSVVMFVGSEDIQVGKEAKRQMLLEPDNVCELVKRHMGDAGWAFEANGKTWNSAEVSAQILKALCEDAELQTREKVEKVVITVPAYFGITEREATIAAGKMAGLDVVDVINEPTAAAMSYGFAQSADVDETVLVYDLGGGTFDVTVIRLEPNDSGSHIRVVATGGNHRLGGAQWDQQVVNLVVSKFAEANPNAPDPLDDEVGSAELRLAAEELKRGLTLRDSVSQIVVSGDARDNVELTREEFESATRDLLDQTIEFTRETVEKAKELGVEKIDRVLLVGGSSFMPAVAERLAESFEGWTPELEDANQAVAKGAALLGFQAELRARLDEEAEARGEDSTSPEVEQSVAKEMSVDKGTVQRIRDTTVTNVCSRGFGVKVLNDGADPDTKNPEDFWIDHVIGPNTPLPAEPEPRTYGTVVPNQTTVNLELWQQAGSELSERLEHNDHIGEGLLQGLPGTDPVGSPLSVTLSMSESGVLKAKARHHNGAELEFEVKAEGAVMSEAEIAAGAERVASMKRL